MNLSQKVAVKRNVTPVRRSRTKQLKKVESFNQVQACPTGRDRRHKVLHFRKARSSPKAPALASPHCPRSRPRASLKNTPEAFSGAHGDRAACIARAGLGDAPRGAPHGPPRDDPSLAKRAPRARGGGLRLGRCVPRARSRRAETRRWPRRRLLRPSELWRSAKRRGGTRLPTPRNRGDWRVERRRRPQMGGSRELAVSGGVGHEAAAQQHLLNGGVQGAERAAQGRSSLPVLWRG